MTLRIVAARFAVESRHWTWRLAGAIGLVLIPTFLWGASQEVTQGEYIYRWEPFMLSLAGFWLATSVFSRLCLVCGVRVPVLAAVALVAFIATGVAVMVLVITIRPSEWTMAGNVSAYFSLLGGTLVDIFALVPRFAPSRLPRSA